MYIYALLQLWYTTHNLCASSIQLYYRRVRIAERYTETRRHLPLLGALGPDGMSTDASDHDNGTGHPVCRIMEEPWRHPDAAHCLRALDALHRDSRFRPVRRNTQGAHPHQRIVSPLVSTRVPPSKLLSGYYNPAWLQVQTAAMKEYLEIIPSEPYSFSHTATIEEYVHLTVIRGPITDCPIVSLIVIMANWIPFTALLSYLSTIPRCIYYTNLFHHFTAMFLLRFSFLCKCCMKNLNCGNGYTLHDMHFSFPVPALNSMTISCYYPR